MPEEGPEPGALGPVRCGAGGGKPGNTAHGSAAAGSVQAAGHSRTQTHAATWGTGLSEMPTAAWRPKLSMLCSWQLFMTWGSCEMLKLQPFTFISGTHLCTAFKFVQIIAVVKSCNYMKNMNLKSSKALVSWFGIATALDFCQAFMIQRASCFCELVFVLPLLIAA